MEKMERVKERGTKRNRMEDKILKKARHFIPINNNEEKNGDSLLPDEKITNTSTEPQPQPVVVKRKKPRKTIRGEDGIKIRQISATNIKPNDIKSTNKNNNKNFKSLSAIDDKDKVTPPSPSPKKKKSKKKKNKKKSQQQLGERNVDGETKHKYEALEFLKRWKYERSDWKFEKLKQVWLLKNALNETHLNEENFDILLEYIISVKGQARIQILKEMQSTMNKIEKDTSLGTNVTSVNYDRSRRIVQMLSED